MADTENVPFSIGLGRDCEIAEKIPPKFTSKMAILRDRLYSNILKGLGDKKVLLNGHPVKRLPNVLNISIRGIVGEELLNQIPEIAASTGRACYAGSKEPPLLLMAMGLSKEESL